MRRQILSITIVFLADGVFGQPAFGAPIGESLGLRAARATLNPIETEIITAGTTLAGTAPAGMCAIMVRGSLAIGGADQLDGIASCGAAPILPANSMSVPDFGQAPPASARGVAGAVFRPRGQTPRQDLAAQIREQGYHCDKPLNAQNDESCHGERSLERG